MKIVKYSDVPYTILGMNDICFDSASIKLRRIRDSTAVASYNRWCANGRILRLGRTAGQIFLLLGLVFAALPVCIAS